MPKGDPMTSRSFPTLLLALTLAACGQGAPDDTAPAPNGAAGEVEATVVAFFDAISGYDYDALRSHVTSDFELVEDTLVLDLQGFIDFIEPYEDRGATITYQLSDFNTEVRGTVGWTRYRNEAVLRSGEDAIPLEWLESAVLLRVGSEWRIDRLQSSPVRRPGGE
jgi:hypothetical protein